MKMSGAVDPLYTAARRALLDALEAMNDHLDAIVLVGAQAIYVHADEADMAIAPFTTDADLALDPANLRPAPLLEERLVRAGFWQEPSVIGIWQRMIDLDGVSYVVAVDLLVPETLGGTGRRAARLPPHGKTVARKVAGLEGALVDKDLEEITALEDQDPRRFTLNVAGPGALLVAKLHKIAERADAANRSNDKDALDVYRLLRAVATEDLGRRIRLLREAPSSRDTTAVALDHLVRFFGSHRAHGCVMAIRASTPLVDADILEASLVVLARDLLDVV